MGNYERERKEKGESENGRAEGGTDLERDCLGNLQQSR